MKKLCLLAALASLAACTTDIHAKDETIRPPKVPFGHYSSVVIKPLVVAHTEGDSSDAEAAERIGAELKQCLEKALPSKGGSSQLIIEPKISDLKKVNTSERILMGSLAGSSAVLLNVKYTDAATRAVIADPTFYAKTAAMSGAWTFGSTDNAMLTRIATTACDYTVKYR